ncbi:MAG: hypothetical protein UMR38_01090 [Candidatus Izemoplasma sp.]|nr:hypothetical protein [Candidatus Izemoplasma sp.]
MIDKIKEVLENKYHITLDEYAIYDANIKRNHTLKVGVFLFVILLTLFVLGENDVLFQLDFIYIVFGLFVLVLIPLGLNKKTEYEAIIVTPNELIQRTGKKTFAVIPYDDITSFNLTEHGIIIKGNGEVITLSLTMFREEIEPIIDILEAKGKTFEKDKEYMVRPIKIHINNNEITIEDVEVKTDTDIVYEQYIDDYNSLTPGFIKEVIMRNSVIDDVLSNTDVLAFKVARFTVKEGHPENTHFDPIQVADGVLIFTKPVINGFSVSNPNDEDKKAKPLEPTAQNIKKYCVDGIISDWKVMKKRIKIDFASGVHSLNLDLKYEAVLIGWNEVKSS